KITLDALKVALDSPEVVLDPRQAAFKPSQPPLHALQPAGHLGPQFLDLIGHAVDPVGQRLVGLHLIGSNLDQLVLHRRGETQRAVLDAHPDLPLPSGQETWLISPARPNFSSRLAQAPQHDRAEGRLSRRSALLKLAVLSHSLPPT